jgi:hypothetical protein
MFKGIVARFIVFDGIVLVGCQKSYSRHLKRGILGTSTGFQYLAIQSYGSIRKSLINDPLSILQLQSVLLPLQSVL